MQVTLTGTPYKVQQSEGLVVFSLLPSRARDRYSRIVFQKVNDCWCLSLISTDGKVMLSHVKEASQLLEQLYGADCTTVGNREADEATRPSG